MSTKKAARRSRKAAGWSEAKASTITLIDAAMGGDCGTITGLLDSGLDVNALIETKEKSGKSVATTALHWAVTNNQEAATRLLLDRGANPNLANSTSAILAMAAVGAAGEGSLPLLRMLLEAKAELNAVESTGWTAFHISRFANRPDCAEALVRAGCDTTSAGCSAARMTKIILRLAAGAVIPIWLGPLQALQGMLQPPRPLAMRVTLPIVCTGDDDPNRFRADTSMLTMCDKIQDLMDDQLSPRSAGEARVRRPLRFARPDPPVLHLPTANRCVLWSVCTALV